MNNYQEGTIRHNIAQMTFTSKVYIPCPLAIIMMSKERRRQKSILEVVAKGKLKDREKQKLTFCKAKRIK